MERLRKFEKMMELIRRYPVKPWQNPPPPKPWYPSEHLRREGR